MQKGWLWLIIEVYACDVTMTQGVVWSIALVSVTVPFLVSRLREMKHRGQVH